MLQEHSKTKKRHGPNQISTWMDGRLTVDNHSSRFWLPMDMKDLEKMSPQTYLLNYCLVSPRKANVCHKTFYKLKDSKTASIPLKDLEKALKDCVVNTFLPEQLKYMCEMLDITEETNIDYKLLCGISAFAERIMFTKFANQDTIDLPENHRGQIERADFCSLNWKFEGIEVNPLLKKVLESLD